MTREDLFTAIGMVEETRLERSELEVMVSGRKPKRTRRIFRNFLIAAILVSMLAVTAYAVAGYLIFESPQAMITAIFGDKTGYDHKGVTTWSDPEKPGSVYENPAYDRVPVDEALAETEVVPMVSPVGQSVSWNGYTLQVDANLYDQVTKCGVLTYTLENPEGLGYTVDNDGSVWFPKGELVGFGQYGYSYIIQDQSNDTKLTASYYYQLRDPNSKDLEIGFTQWASRTMEEEEQRIVEIKQELRQEMTEEEALEYRKMSVGDMWPWFEENRTREENIESAYEELAYQRLEDPDMCPDKIIISEQALGEMSSITLKDGDITISPIAMYLDITDWTDYPEFSNKVCILRFADGTEYVVRDETHENYMFAVGNGERNDVNYMFNRIVDVNEITSVVLDGGIEISVT